MLLGPRSRGLTPRKDSSGGMDLGTRALILGACALALSWIPVLNIVAFIAALMAVGFGLLARWPTGWLTNDEPNTKRALWAVILGGIALVIFVVTAVRYSAI